jgi:hypothetical protein
MKAVRFVSFGIFASLLPLIGLQAATPTPVTLPVSNITATSADFSGTVNANGGTAKAYFEFQAIGDSFHYGSAQQTVTGNTPTTLTHTPAFLTGNKAYRVRLIAWDSTVQGSPIQYGEYQEFNTLNRAPEPKHVTRSSTPTNGFYPIYSIPTDATDPDGDDVYIESYSYSGPGTLAISANSKALTFQNGGFVGSQTVQVTVRDDFGGSATGSVTLTNTVPNATPDYYVAEDTQITFTPASNDTDLESNTSQLSLLSITQPATGKGTAFRSGLTVYYTPPRNHYGPVTFTYQLSDGRGGISTGELQVFVAPSHIVQGSGRVELVAPEDGDATWVEFKGVPGKQYMVQYKEDLAAATWTDLGPDTVAPNVNGLVGMLDEAFPRPAQRYYRAVSVP